METVVFEVDGEVYALLKTFARRQRISETVFARNAETSEAGGLEQVVSAWWQRTQGAIRRQRR